MKQFLDLERRFVIAHRGGARSRPENTVAAFDHAVALGVDAIECDIHLSKDGQPVVIHDATLERTTNSSGAVREYTADALNRMDAAWAFEAAGEFSFRGQDIGVPTLAQVLQRYRGMSFMIELKVARDEDAAPLAAAAIDVVTRCDAVDRVLFGSFNTAVLDHIRASPTPFITSASASEGVAALIRSTVMMGPGRTAYQLFQVPEERKGRRVVSPRFVRIARKAGLPVHVWVVNDEADMRRLLGWGVTGLISDVPEAAIKTIASLS